MSLLLPGQRQGWKVPEKALLAQALETLAGLCFGDRVLTRLWSQPVVFLAANT